MCLPRLSDLQLVGSYIVGYGLFFLRMEHTAVDEYGLLRFIVEKIGVFSHHFHEKTFDREHILGRFRDTKGLTIFRLT